MKRKHRGKWAVGVVKAQAEPTASMLLGHHAVQIPLCEEALAITTQCQSGNITT